MHAALDRAEQISGYSDRKVEDWAMATWHQQQADRAGRTGTLFHSTEWTVVIDPPGQMRALYRTSTKQLAEVYMRNLRDNNPGAAAHAYILPPAKRSK